MCVWWQVSALEQRCQKLELEVQKLAQTWSEAAPAEEIKVRSGLVCRIDSEQVTCCRLPCQKRGFSFRVGLHCLLEQQKYTGTTKFIITPPRTCIKLAGADMPEPCATPAFCATDVHSHFTVPVLSHFNSLS